MENQNVQRAESLDAVTAREAQKAMKNILS